MIASARKPTAAKSVRQSRGSSGQPGVVKAIGCVLQGGLNVLLFQVGQFFEDLVFILAGGEQIEDIGNPDAHATDTGPAAALAGVEGDAIGERGLHEDDYIAEFSKCAKKAAGVDFKTGVQEGSVGEE